MFNTDIQHAFPIYSRVVLKAHVQCIFSALIFNTHIRTHAQYLCSILMLDTYVLLYTILMLKVYAQHFFKTLLFNPSFHFLWHPKYLLLLRNQPPEHVERVSIRLQLIIITSGSALPVDLLGQKHSPVRGYSYNASPCTSL